MPEPVLLVVLTVLIINLSLLSAFFMPMGLKLKRAGPIPSKRSSNKPRTELMPVAVIDWNYYHVFESNIFEAIEIGE